MKSPRQVMLPLPLLTPCKLNAGLITHFEIKLFLIVIET